MTFKQAIETENDVMRRRSKASHLGATGNGWVSLHYLLECCSNGCGLMGSLCMKPHLTIEDILADDWEVKSK